MKRMATIDYMKGWAWNMFESKLIYHYNTIQTTFEIAKETEKAVQLIVDTNDLYSDFGNDYVGTIREWFVWMPKSALMCIEEVEG